jgi:hypothetical protein
MHHEFEMDYKQINERLYGLLERLAGIEHERWARWQRYMHSKGHRQLTARY